MKTRNLTRKSLDELAKVMPALSETTQLEYVGKGLIADLWNATPSGSDATYFNTDSGSFLGSYGEFEYDSGSILGNEFYTDNPSGNTSNKPYTVEDYNRMVSNSTWKGGYVEGWGYIASDATAIGYTPNHNPNVGDERYNNMYAGGYKTGFNNGYYEKDNNTQSGGLESVWNYILNSMKGVIGEIGSLSGVENGDLTLIYYNLGYRLGYEAGVKAREQFDSNHPE